MSLWVVLMVPVSAFAAVVAMAGPQRLAAESSVKEAAGDMATAAVAWRYSHEESSGQIPVFPPECSNATQTTRFDDAIALSGASIADYQDRITNFPIAGETLTKPELEQALQQEQTAHTRLTGDRNDVLTAWRTACEQLFEWIVQDLGYLGVDVNSMRGFYSDSLFNPADPTAPCKVSQKVRVEDAVHVALAADWQYAGWAAAQVWPDGMRMGAESIGRRSRAVDNADDPVAINRCEDRLDVLDDQGRPLTLSFDPTQPPPSRVLAESSPERTAFSG